MKVWTNSFAICFGIFETRLTTIILEVLNIRGRHCSCNVHEQDPTLSADKSWHLLRLSIWPGTFVFSLLSFAFLSRYWAPEIGQRNRFPIERKSCCIWQKMRIITITTAIIIITIKQMISTVCRCTVLEYKFFKSPNGLYNLFSFSVFYRRKLYIFQPTY